MKATGYLKPWWVNVHTHVFSNNIDIKEFFTEYHLVEYKSMSKTRLVFKTEEDAVAFLLRWS